MQESIVFEIRLLQTPSIQLNGMPLTIKLKKAEAAFYYLLIEKSASRDTLAAMIWGEEPRELARRHLRDCIYALNKGLGLRVIVPKDRYALELNPEYTFSCDVSRFLDSPTEVEVYQGSFLHEFHVPQSLEYEEWVEFNRSRLQEEYLHRRMQMAQAAFAAGAFSDAEKHLLAYLQYDPVSEAAVLLLMKVYAARAEYSKAAARYQQLRKTLADELGITPLKETTAVYSALMEEWNSAATEEKAQGKQLLIGRGDVLFRMCRNLRTPERAKHLILSGDPGVGKSFLLNQFLKAPELSAYHVLMVSCYQSKSAEPMYPWQMIAGQMLDLLADQRAASDRSAGAGLYDSCTFSDIQSLTMSVSRRMRLLLALEDIQWIDEASLRVLDFIMRQIPAERLCVVATCRSAVPEQCSAFLSAMKADRLAEQITLVPFTREESDAALDAFGSGAFSEGMKKKIFDETQGNAFLLFRLIDYSLNGAARSESAADPAQMLEYRLNDLNDQERLILNLIAMFPGNVPWDILCRLSSASMSDLTCACQELIRRGLIRDIDCGMHIVLSFVSEEYRLLVYEKMPRLTRRTLHRSIAESLAKAEQADFPDALSMAEYHYRQSGDEISALNCAVQHLKLFTSVWLYCFTHNPFVKSSEEQMLSVFDETEQRVGHLRAQYINTQQLDRIYAELLLAKLSFMIYSGTYKQISPTLDILLSWPASDADTVTQTHILAAEYAIQIGDLQLLQTHVEQGFAVAQSRSDWCSCEKLERYRGLCLLRQGFLDAARQKFADSIRLADRALEQGLLHDTEVGFATNYIGDSYYWNAEYDKASDWYRKAVVLMKNRSAPVYYSAFLANLGRSYFARQKYAEAKACFKDAMAQTQFSWRTEWLVYSTAFLALYAYAAHDEQESIHLIERSEALANAYQNPGEMQSVLLAKAILRKRLEERSESGSPLARLLDQPTLHYVGQLLSYGKMDPLCSAIVSALFMQSGTTDQVLPGFWQERAPQPLPV